MIDRAERYRFQGQLGLQLERIEDLTKLYKVALGQIGRHMGASAGAVILRHPVSDELTVFGWGRSGSDWDEDSVRAFLELRRPRMQPNEIMAPILIHGRPAGLMALRRSQGEFWPGAGRWLAILCRKLAHEAALREEQRVNRVVDQIKDKTVRELRPKDLFYQILHGLRSLTRYDHSSALLLVEEDCAHLVLHAEQIAWHKRKSARIGKRIKVPEDLRPALRSADAPGVVSFGRGGARRNDSGEAAGKGRDEIEPLARSLRWGGRKGEPAEGTILLAPLQHERQVVAILKIATRRRGALGDPEARAVERVVPHIVSVIHNARRALSMEERIITAEKKNAMADLARAISHDVKNAIGSILPLAEQAREEVSSGTFDRDVLAADLQQIEQSAQICQRIFDGMLHLARSGVRPPERAPLSTIVDGTLSILGTRLKRLGVSLELKIPEDLPEVNASRGGLEQLFLNLFTNALEAMPAGGKLRIQARRTGGRVEVKVTDTGAGIPPDQIERIHEPFFTTKYEGFGLGLSICRSIVWEIGGEMKVESKPGQGTTITVALPIAPPAPADRVPSGPSSRPRAAGVSKGGS